MPAAAKPLTIQAGALLAGRYRITREIGRGGMAQVYESEHLDIGKRVAIKILAAEFAASTVVVERFLREARAAAAVRSPYICDVFDSGKLEDGRPFLVMELLEGESLYERMVRVRQFDAATTLRIATHVGRGLTKAHAANIVHRDLKPENIFLTADEDSELLSKILDFGLAKFYAPAAEAGEQARLTREGAIFGTPAYMSPEQVKGQGAVDHRADLWALGCIVYECLTGRTVWSTEQGVAMTFAQIASAPLPKLGRYRPDLPPTLDDWFRRALERDISERFQSSKELTDALADALEQSPPSLLAAPSSLDVLEGREAPGTQPDGFNFESAFEQLETTAPAAPVALANVANPAGRPSTPNPGSAGAPASARLAPAAGESGGQRMPAASLVDTGTSSSVKEQQLYDLPEPLSKRRRSSGWSLLTVMAVAGAGVAGWELYRTRNVPDVSGGKAPTATSVASAGSSGPTFDSNPTLPTLPTAPPRWVSLVQGGQEMVSRGELEGALKTFREAAEVSPNAQTRAIIDQANAGLTNKGPCRLSGLGRLRPYTMASGTVGRPQLVKTNRALLALWTDDHEGAKRDHAYAMALDYALRPASMPIDLTPEAEDVGVVSARAVGERVAMLYADTRGSRAGLWLRWLDGDGRIEGPNIDVAKARAAGSQASIAGDGPEQVWAVWEEERDGDSIDLIARPFDTRDHTAPEARLTDFLGRSGVARTRAAQPSVAMTAGALQLLFRLERDTTRTVQHMAVLDVERLGAGIVSPPHGARSDRVAGLQLHQMPLNGSEKDDTPQLACDALACFGAWHVERPGGGGAYATFIDPKTGQVIWRKRFASVGGRPTVAMGPPGVARLVWFEQNRVRTATISREGIGPTSALARVSGGADLPPPSVVMGTEASDWAISWLDLESGRPEPYVLRATCPTSLAPSPVAPPSSLPPSLGAAGAAGVSGASGASGAEGVSAPGGPLPPSGASPPSPGASSLSPRPAPHASDPSPP